MIAVTPLRVFAEVSAILTLMRIDTIEVGGNAVITRDTGWMEAPRTFVLVHGMGSNYFEGLSEALAPYGRVIAMDLPGFGDASEPEISLPMSGMGKVLVDFVELEGLSSAILVGHSMGTEVVSEAAVVRPELFPELVLIAPTVNAAERTIWRQAWRMAQDLFGESPRVIWLGVQNYVKTGPRWFIKKLNAMMEHQPELTYPKIQARTLVIRGSKDHVVPRYWAEQAAELLPHGSYVEIPGRRHETMIKDPDDVADAILAHIGISAVAG